MAHASFVARDWRETVLRSCEQHCCVGPVRSTAMAADARARTSVALLWRGQLGGAVRLTGSGLGCPTWPKCTEESLVSTSEMGFHGLIEFGNRVLTFVLLIVALLTFIVVVRISTSTSKIGKLSIGFFSGAILLVFGLVAHEVLGLVVASILVFSLSFGLMVFFVF